jgi:ubiquinone/menaquinone biosynthesis C-methylase UbiE
MKKDLKVMTTDELKNYWNDFEDIYSTYMEHNGIPMYVQMTNLLKLKHMFQSPNNLNILELSVGSGEGLYYLITTALLFNTMNKKINIYATDLSDKMLEAAYEKIRQISNIGISYKNLKNTKEQAINIYVSEADNEKLPFQDDFFDIVLSNFSLHLVPHPDIMLKECLRVTKASAWNSFTFFGNPKQSLVFLIFDKALQKLGLYEESKVRSSFHLSIDIKALIDFVLENGYSSVNISQSFIPFDILEPSDYEGFYGNPRFKKILAGMSEENAEKLKNEIHLSISEILERNELIGLHNTVIICKK